MLVFVSGLVIFIAAHSISIVNRPWRDRMAATLGEPMWK
ncbi:MAG: NnrU family protein, partial [Gammaproteobacteria bacterium]